MEERRPTPEEMLARASAEEARAKRGRLKIFFGAAPGVGKTYAMLEAAQARKRDGRDVVVGWVQTHKRSETDALTVGLERIPPHPVEYRGVTLDEFDLDAALARRPALILVDELAHTNAPGSRHTRRWQDIDELLEAGIDVYTTLNVQHVESLNDVIAQITGVVVRETVPDSILDRADEIALVDLLPDDLLQRLKEGKVYVPTQAERAIQSFFRKGNLTALRELALRRTAERVDAQVDEYKREHGITKPWPTRERILVAVGPSPQSANLVRAAFRMADRLRAPWIALSVETPAFDQLHEEDRARAAAHLALAERLGAETLVVRGERMTDEILAVAHQRNVTRIVVGKTSRRRWIHALRGSAVDALVQRSGGIDVLVTTGEDGGVGPRPATSAPRPGGTLGEYAWALGAVGASTALCAATRNFGNIADQSMTYLLGVLIVSSRCSRGPSVVAAIASVAAFDFFFVPPVYTFAVGDWKFAITFGVMLVVALTVSGFTSRIRQQAEAARQRERRTAALYGLSRMLAIETEVGRIAGAAVRHVRELFETDAVVWIADGDGRLVARGGAECELARDEHPLEIAKWVFDHGQAAGHATESLPASDALFLPLVGAKRTLGVFGITLGGRGATPSPAQRQLIETLVAQTALALERALLSDEASSAQVTAETERMRSALLSTVSHDLRTPLASITGSAGALLDPQATLDANERRELLETIREEAERLSHLVGDLLELTRLESGALRVKKEWYPLEEIVASALGRLADALGSRDVRIDLPTEVLVVLADAALLEEVFINLVENAAKFSAPGTPIEIRARAGDGEVQVEVADRGPGFAPDEIDRLFEKFYRGAGGSRVAGSGLGLAVCDAIVKAHGGRIRADNRAGGGAIFRFWLPLGESPPAIDADVEAPTPEAGA
ncbi:MAG: sensor histidine kinase KdpD [Planctomycetes bacterium]|nr:sensor histidine kinase KdpD [Planctomycetota bacterium]